MSESSFNSQIIYNWAGGSRPVRVGEGEKAVSTVSHEDFLNASLAGEEALGQKILQDNQDKLRIAQNIADQSLTTLDPTLGTLPQTINQLNGVISILQTLVAQGKNQ